MFRFFVLVHFFLKHHTKGTGSSNRACQLFVWCFVFFLQLLHVSGEILVCQWYDWGIVHLTGGKGSIGSCLPAPGELCGFSFILLQGVRDWSANRCKVVSVNTHFGVCALTSINLRYDCRRMLIGVDLCIQFDPETRF